MTGSCHVTAADAARALLLGAVARAEAVPLAALKNLASAALEANPIVRLAMRVLDEHEPRRLARAIELAGEGLDNGAVRQPSGETRSGEHN